ncbi:protein ANTAGONIST OF LIKE HETEROCHROMATIN PROTEIN 1-like isoform X2 [Sceloporus undulatus]|uniref:protein ANTAGONIST OF LIKE HETEROCHROMATIN PROTEIN 1-like isoform X2 n=1 Tax=Sceloporus undulatus TaxID=8520 RepID=UPI001C4AAA47|nr:protein ANTAGONIST OF LIKE HETEROCHROMATIN PROTEIN 1-like isoform X2 [Sceloporus undulatus]
MDKLTRLIDGKTDQQSQKKWEKLRTRISSSTKRAVPVDKQVAMTIYFLANGDSFSTVATYFGVEKSTACKAILQVVTAMEMVLLRKAVYLGDYRKVMAGFEALGFPQAIGAVDGCRVRIVPPVEPGAEFTNRKPPFSMVLLGTCDHTGRFTDVLIGWPASNHYSFILRTSGTYNAMRAGVFISERPSLTIAGKQVGPLLLADVNYPLKPWLMTPFKGSVCPQQAVYNQRHSQARNVVKAAFARLKARWRCLTSSLEVAQTNANSFLAACVILHNIVESDGEVLTSGPRGPKCFTVNPANFLPEDVETQEGKDIRQAFMAFFCAQNQ